VWELQEDGGAGLNWLQNSDESKVVFSEDAALHMFVILNKQQFFYRCTEHFNQVRDIQQMLISSFIVLISSPTCFGFQVPFSGGYNFLIYKLTPGCLCVSGGCGLLFVRGGL
jgi:hypothetical protein